MNKFMMIAVMSAYLLPFTAASNIVREEAVNSVEVQEVSIQADDNIESIESSEENVYSVPTEDASDSFFSTPEGGYFSAKTGMAFITDNCAKKETCDDSAQVYGANFGYNFGKWGGFELGLGSMAPTRTTHLSNFQDESHMNFYNLHYVKGFGGRTHQLLLKVGALSWVNESSGLNSALRTWGTSATAGIAYQYRLDEYPLGIQVGYDYVNQFGGKNTNGHLVTLGLTYFFSQPVRYIPKEKLAAPNLVQPGAISTPVATPIFVQSESMARDNLVQPKQLQDAPLGSSPVIKVCFENDSSELDDFNKNVLETLYEHLPKYSRLNIIGFADSNGSVEYNKNLVQQRVDSIQGYLKELATGKDKKLLNIDTINTSNVAPRHSKHSMNRCSEIIIVH